MKVDARWEGLDELQRDLERAAREASPALGDAVRSATHRTRYAIAGAAPGPTVAANVRQRVTGAGETTEGTVYLTSPATIVAVGSRRHAIAPVNRRALRLGTGFAAHVEHPGTRPNDFMERGARDADGELEEVMTQAAERVERKITRR